MHEEFLCLFFKIPDDFIAEVGATTGVVSQIIKVALADIVLRLNIISIFIQRNVHYKLSCYLQIHFYVADGTLFFHSASSFQLQ